MRIEQSLYTCSQTLFLTLLGEVALNKVFSKVGAVKNKSD